MGKGKRRTLLILKGAMISACIAGPMFVINDRANAARDPLYSVRGMFKSREISNSELVVTYRNETLERQHATSDDYARAKTKLMSDRRLLAWKRSEGSIGYGIGDEKALGCKQACAVDAGCETMCDGKGFIMHGSDPLTEIDLWYVPALHLLELEYERPAGKAEVEWATVLNAGKDPVRHMKLGSWGP